MVKRTDNYVKRTKKKIIIHGERNNKGERVLRTKDPLARARYIVRIFGVNEGLRT